jgi:transcriptional regulator with XRE-family HTH domain
MMPIDADIGGAKDRLAAARNQCGRSVAALAAVAGVTPAGYWHLEHDTELLDTLSLRSLQALCRALGLRADELLFGSERPSAVRPLSFAALLAAVQRRQAALGLSTDEWSERIGWELAGPYAAPGQLWSYTAEALKDLCEAAGQSWRAALAGLDTESATAPPN